MLPSYKDRKDIGDTKARSNVEQQPTKALDDKQVRQSYADKVKAERKESGTGSYCSKKEWWRSKN